VRTVDRPGQHTQGKRRERTARERQREKQRERRERREREEREKRDEREKERDRQRDRERERGIQRVHTYHQRDRGGAEGDRVWLRSALTPLVMQRQGAAWLRAPSESAQKKGHMHRHRDTHKTHRHKADTHISVSQAVSQKKRRPMQGDQQTRKEKKTRTENKKKGSKRKKTTHREQDGMQRLGLGQPLKDRNEISGRRQTAQVAGDLADNAVVDGGAHCAAVVALLQAYECCVSKDKNNKRCSRSKKNKKSKRNKKKNRMNTAWARRSTRGHR
jgi:hypothetical protein